jgi:hypothetical protein
MLFDTKGTNSSGRRAVGALRDRFDQVSRWAFILVAVCGLLALGSDAAQAQATFESDTGATGCDGFWTTSDCWSVTSGTDDGDGYPSTANEDAVIPEDNFIQVDVSGLNVGSITIQNSDGDATDDAVAFVNGPSSIFTVNGSVDNSGSFTLDSGPFGTGNVNVTGGLINQSGAETTVGRRKLTVEGGITNSGTISTTENGEIEVQGSFANNGSTSFSSAGNGSTVFFNGDFGSTATAQSLSGDFSNGNSFSNLVVGSDARVDPENSLSGSAPVTVDGNLTVQNGGEYGTPSGEGSDFLYAGSNFSIIGTGSFNANRLSFNNPGSNSASPVIASGEVFSIVQITGNSYVRINSRFEVNGLLTLESEELNVEPGGSLVINDDFSVADGATYSPSTSSATIFSGGTNTGPVGDENYDPGDSSCVGDGGLPTSDGDCEQDVRSAGALNFEPVQVEGDDTRVTVSTDDQNNINPQVANLTIDPLPLNDNVQFVLDNANLVVTANIVNNGVFIPGGRRVIFEGGGDQDIISTTDLDFFDVTVNNTGGSAVDVLINPGANISVENQIDVQQGGIGFSSGVSDDASLSILGELRLSGGTVYTARGTVTLVSQGGGGGVDNADGYVTYVDDNVMGGDGTLDGDIVGDIVKQRELDGGQEWYFFSAPEGTSTNDTFNEFLREGGDNSLWLQGFTGANAEAGNPAVSNVRFYDESVSGDDDNGYVSINAASDEMETGRGYIVYVFTNDDFSGGSTGNELFPKLIDSVVEPTSDISFDYSPLLSVTDNGPGAQDGDGNVDDDEGWNLLGNPYLATLDWSAMSRTNIDNAVYVWDPSSSAYVAFGADAGVGGLTDGNIAPQQGFLVKASNGTDPDNATYSLSIDDITDVQATTSGFFQKSTTPLPPAVTFRATLDNIERETYVAFVEGTSMDKDPSDAYQLGAPLTGNEGQFSLFTALEDGTGLNINALPFGITEEVTIPMSAVARGCSGGIPFGGTVTLTWPEIRNMPSEVELAIRDTQTGDVIDIRSQNSYQFTVSSNDNCTTQTAKQSSQGGQQIAPPNPVIMKASASKSGGLGSRLEFIVTPNDALPVEMGSFTGSIDGQDAAILEWNTLSESNNSGFYVEQKVDGRFQSVSSLIEGAGTTTEQQSYRYRVEDLEEGTTHTFRLRQVDVDGAKTYSETVDVKIGIQEAYQLEAYPNPVANGQQPTVRFAVDESQPVTIELYNTLGQRVRTLYNDTPRVTGEFQDVNLDVNGLASGVYFIRMRGESFATTQKLVVVR